MSAHTPGPWRWLDRDTLLGDHGKRPCVLSARDLRQRDTHTALLVPLDVESPDARLIAAAPDLLAVLRECVDFVDGVSLSDPEDRPLRLPLLAKISAAIAKAEGKS